MAYRFNNGLGGVTCDVCNILIDSRLDYKEYLSAYNQDGKPDLCLKCKEGNSEGKDNRDEVPVLNVSLPA